MNTIIYGKNTHEHPFHIVDVSPWPFTTSMSLATLLFGSALYLHNYSYGLFVLVYGLIFLIYSLVLWWRDVIREATFEGQHTKAVQTGLRIAFLLFILSEVCFFATFFWGYFHASLAPNIELGGIWPPLGIELINPWGIPFLNTLLLLSSGITITWAHYAITTPDTFPDNLIFDKDGKPLLKITSHVSDLTKALFKDVVLTETPTVKITSSQYNIKKVQPSLTKFGNFDSRSGVIESASMFPNNHYQAKQGLLITIILGTIFLVFQAYEYAHASFIIADGMYGASFYSLTGFHGLHVLVGTIFLVVCYIRHIKYHFTIEHHVGFETAIWYWHFVDVVWLFLFISIYWWGGA